MTEQLYKVLRRDGDKFVSCYGGHGAWTIGRWRSAKPPLKPCVHGIHLCRGGDLVHWLDEVVCPVEYTGERIDCDNKVVVQRARIGAPLETWDAETARLFAVDCARIAVNRYAREDQRESLHAVLDVTTARALYPGFAAAETAARAAARAAAEAEQTTLLMRYLAGEQGPFVEAGVTT